ncbi:hypothetical protein Tco_1047643 [Tanacetum coccineum]
MYDATKKMLNKTRDKLSKELGIWIKRLKVISLISTDASFNASMVEVVLMLLVRDCICVVERGSDDIYVGYCCKVISRCTIGNYLMLLVDHLCCQDDTKELSAASIGIKGNFILFVLKAVSYYCLLDLNQGEAEVIGFRFT